MKYYAVTEDPNELFHYGRRGMKWGKHIFGDKPKSPGYKRALGKLRASTKSIKSAIQKSATQYSMNRQKRQQNKYNQAVKKAQRNNELVENLYNLDKVRVNERGLDRDYWGAAKIARIQDKQQRKIDRINNKLAIKQLKQEVKYSKKELNMDKLVQKARSGKLKYGQLSDDQVQRLTDRLNMEQRARNLGSTEKTWRQQKKEAFRQGKLQGITRGTAAAMEEVARAGTIYGIQNFMNRKKRNALAKQQGKEQRIKNREQNRKSAKDIRDEVKQEAYESEVRSGKGFLDRSFGTHMTVGQAAKLLQKNNSAEHERQRIQNVQDRLANERDEMFNKAYITEKGYRNDEEAVKAHKKALSNDTAQAEARWGITSQQAIEARGRENKFNKSSAEDQKRLMVSYENNRKKQEEDTKKANAMELYRQARSIEQDNNMALDRYYAKMNAYQNQLKNPNKSTNAKPPVKPRLKNLPNIDAESLSILNSMGLNPYKTGGGGGKKKNN